MEPAPPQDMRSARDVSRHERRCEPRRGFLHPVVNLSYRTFRWIARHVRGFHAAVGLFLSVGLVISALAILTYA